MLGVPITLTAQHWIYLAVIIIVIIAMVRKKDVILPCIVGTLLIGLVAGGWDIVFAVQTVFRSMYVAASSIIGIIIVIALMMAMLRPLAGMGADQMMITPAAKMIKSPAIAFWVIAGVMYILSTFFWPPPATALVGTILIPIAVKAGLKPLLACMALNIAGHGMALSGDIIIQGAPSLTAYAAGVPVSGVLFYGALFGAITGITALIAAFLLNRKEITAGAASTETTGASVPSAGSTSESSAKKSSPYAKYFAIGVPIVFLLILVRIVLGSMDMGFSSIVGGAASALLGGTAAVILLVATIADSRTKALEKMVEHTREGFMFGIRIFAPIIPIAGFFLLGAPNQAAQILGEGAPGLLFDLGSALVDVLPLSAVPVTVGMVLVAAITGLDGSGFSTLPLLGTLSASLATPLNLNVEVLTGLSQSVGIFVGAGTLPAWAIGVAAAAGVAGVSPVELVRKNFVPVIIGFAVSTIVAVFLL